MDVWLFDFSIVRDLSTVGTWYFTVVYAKCNALKIYLFFPKALPLSSIENSTYKTRIPTGI